MSAALLFAVNAEADHVRVVAADPEPLERADAQLDSLGPVLDAATAELPIRLKGGEAAAVGATVGVNAPLDAVLLVPARRPSGGGGYVLMLGDVGGRAFPLEEIEAVSAFVGAANASLSQVTLLERGSRTDVIDERHVLGHLEFEMHGIKARLLIEPASLGRQEISDR